MLGAIIGDIIGSVYEIHNVKTEDFPLFTSESHFTDDSVLTLAVAEQLMADKSGKSQCSPSKGYAMWYKQYYRKYPNAGFGQMFQEWASSYSLKIQRSYGNGAAMRVVPIGYMDASIDSIFNEVKTSCYYTHHNREAIRYARAVALCVYLAKHDCDKAEIQKSLQQKLRIEINFSLDEIRDSYTFNSRSNASVPQAIAAFLEGSDYESTIRKAISIGGDSDTIACMAGGIAEAYYKEIPKDIQSAAYRYMDGTMKGTVERFHRSLLPN